MSSPRVEACIAEVMARHPGTKPAELARYYEDVHQELAPLARTLEAELASVRENYKQSFDHLVDQVRMANREAAAANRRARWVLENAGRMVELVRRWDPTQGTLMDYLEHRVRRELGEIE